MKKISVIGGGHVGLVSAVCFANSGYDVILCERDIEKTEHIRTARPPFFEPSLEVLLKKTIDVGRLRVSTRIRDAVSDSEITFVAVETPSKPDGSIDLTSIETSSAETGEALRGEEGYHLVVIRSTVIPGTTENVVRPIIEKRSGKRVGEDFGLAMQPEFLREGSAIEDTLNPNRIVIGEYDKRSGEVLERLCLDFYRGKAPPIIRMNLASAEMVKYASNAFLTMKISFINQVANLCEKMKEVDVVKVADAMGLDERIGRKFLNAGVGFGGPCLGKDLRAFINFSCQLGYTSEIFEAVLNVNERQARHVVDLAARELGGLKAKTIAILGLSFKPNTDDVKDSPSIRIINELLKEGASLVAYDPKAIGNARLILGEKVRYASSALECLSDTDCCIVATEWDEFKRLSPQDFSELMRKPLLINGRRIFDPGVYGKSLRYVAVGLGASR